MDERRPPPRRLRPAAYLSADGIEPEQLQECFRHLRLREDTTILDIAHTLMLNRYRSLGDALDDAGVEADVSPGLRGRSLVRPISR